MSDAFLKVEGLSKHFTQSGFFSLFGKADTVTRAVDGISFTVARGEVFGIVGESGSGKSTTARMITQLTDATAGRVEFDGVSILDLPKAQTRALRRRIQMVFQDPYTSLNPRMRVREIIGTPLRLHRIVPPGQVEGRVAELLEQVGLRPEHAGRYPHEFSGGQRQRISIARALAVEPDLIVADEAVSALDVSVQAQILNLFNTLRASRNLTYLFIAHDLGVVEHLCDRVAVMYGGRIVEMGPVDLLFGAPAHPYTEALLSAIPEPDPTRPFNPQLRGIDLDRRANTAQGCVFHDRCPLAKDICAEAAPVLETRDDGRAAACHFR